MANWNLLCCNNLGITWSVEKKKRSTIDCFKMQDTELLNLSQSVVSIVKTTKMCNSLQLEGEEEGLEKKCRLQLLKDQDLQKSTGLEMLVGNCGSTLHVSQSKRVSRAKIFFEVSCETIISNPTFFFQWAIWRRKQLFLMCTCEAEWKPCWLMTCSSKTF